MKLQNNRDNLIALFDNWADTSLHQPLLGRAPWSQTLPVHQVQFCQGVEIPKP